MVSLPQTGKGLYVTADADLSRDMTSYMLLYHKTTQINMLQIFLMQVFKLLMSIFHVAID